MADFFVNKVPMPVSRPSGLDMEYQPYTEFKMPLEGPRKAADAFSEGTRYLPTGEEVKSLYGLPRALERHITEIHDFITKTGEEMRDLLSQTYPHYVEPGSQFVANFIEFVLYTGLAVGVIALGYLGWIGISKLVSWVCGNR